VRYGDGVGEESSNPNVLVASTKGMKPGNSALTDFSRVLTGMPDDTVDL